MSSRAIIIKKLGKIDGKDNMYGRKIIGAWEWGLPSWEVGFYSNTEGHASLDGRRTIPLQLSYVCDAVTMKSPR